MCATTFHSGSINSPSSFHERTSHFRTNPVTRVRPQNSSISVEKRANMCEEIIVKHNSVEQTDAIGRPFLEFLPWFSDQAQELLTIWKQMNTERHTRANWSDLYILLRLQQRLKEPTHTFSGDWTTHFLVAWPFFSTSNIQGSGSRVWILASLWLCPVALGMNLPCAPVWKRMLEVPLARTKSDTWKFLRKVAVSDSLQHLPGPTPMYCEPVQ